ncbi:MAG: hypothetical protein KAR16_13980 [Bacteroidales bacterium]|nr:hypothetical protein [Bacteroidales bacterium]
MRKYYLLLTGALLVLLSSGCTSVKRFKSAKYQGTDHTLVDVELFSSGLTGSEADLPDKHLWNLSASAQTRLIQALDERYPDNEQFMDALGKAYLVNEDAPVVDLTRKDLRMVFAISKERDYARLNDATGRFSPADRIEYLEISLEIPDQHHLKFTEWNRYVTEYGEIEIADVSFSRSVNLDAGGNLGESDLGGKFSLNRDEKQMVSERYLKLNGRISDHRVVIEEEGTREIDLTGNVTAEVSMKFGGFPEIVVIPLFSDAGDRGGPAELTALKLVDVLVPAMENAPDTLFALLTMDYIYRHVQSGWLTYAEWDDQVEYYRGSVQKKVSLFLGQDYLPPFYCIGSDQEGKEALKYRKNPQREYLLQFRDYRDASRFLEWLQNPLREQNKPVFIGSNELLYRGDPITPDRVLGDQLKVMPVY